MQLPNKRISGRKAFPYIFVGVLVMGIVLGMQIKTVISSDNTFQQLRKLEEAFSFISKRYVQDVDTSKLVETAIEGMLQGLDPHSVYINAERMKRVQENFDASFEGIGIWYEIIKDTIVVTLPITGGPSEKAGLEAGDRIVAVDDSNAVGFTNEDVVKHLRGPKGTNVNITVKRPNYRQPMRFVVTRDEIPLYTIDASYMVDDKTGYIKLNRFARTTYTEFMEALNKLKAEGMERLVFDLRDNPGGYMEMAVRISDEFLGGGQMIVYTQSRHSDGNQEFRARNGGAWENQPVIVLVNGNSASASEIVAGALQDHDRGLIVGRRTFGKGLVQKQFPLSDGSVLQMTVSRYYTPAGRLIQTPYDDGEQEDYQRQKVETIGKSISARDLASELPDSLKFRTDRGRLVFGGGGILPDYIVPIDSVASIVEGVIRKNIDNEFTLNWLDQNGATFRNTWESRRTDYIEQFEVTPEMWQQFWDFASRQGLEIVDTPPARAAAGLEEENATLYFSSADVEAHREVIEARIKGHIARKVWGMDMWLRVVQQIDPVFLEAMTQWQTAEELAMFSASR